MTFGLALFIAALLVVIMVHESGHFVVAKAFGFKATKFFLGFGPTVWSVQKGETEYGIKALPLGGFVKIVGMSPYEEIPPEDQARSYPNKPRWQRALVIAAGSATHWVVAFLLLIFASMVIGFPTGPPTNKLFEVTTEVDGVQTAAGEAGLQPGDRVVGVDGRTIESWREVRAFIRNHAEDRVSFQIEHGGEIRSIQVTLGTGLFAPDGGLIDYAPPGETVRAPRGDETVAGFLGVKAEPKYVTESFGGAIGESGRLTWEITRDSISQIGNVFTPVFNGELLDAIRGEGERPGGVGIVGASRLAGESVQKGRYLDFIGLIVGFTIFVGIINLLPLPPLDGGHLAVVGYEAITGREVDVRKLIPIAAAVISFFIVLFLAYFYLDVVKPISPF